MTNRPTCGERLQATIPVYLDDVVVDSDGNVAGFTLAFETGNEGPFAWDDPAARVYCVNDNGFGWAAVDRHKLPRLTLSRPSGRLSRSRTNAHD